MERYLFHVHARLGEWRLILIKGAPAPDGFVEADWRFTRERTAEDTSPDVRRLCAETGYCLFRLGGAFDDVAAEEQRRLAP